MYSTPTGSHNLHTPAPGPALLAAALRYAARGWHVFPCHTPTETGCSCRRACGRIGKHPRTQHGLKDATTAAATIQRWWRQWPETNIGLVTGAVSGLVVLDEDSYKGGDTSRVELERTYQPLPETVQQLTGGGGVQYCFAHPGTHVKNGVETLGVGLDIRGDGGYVIVPPSLHASGRRYAWELSHLPDETPLAPMPAWLLALCQDTIRREAPSAGEPIPQGQRNQTLFQLGCGIRARGLSEAAIAGALTAINTTQCQPPLDAAEVNTIAASCAQYPAGQAREDTRQRQNRQPTPGTPGPAAAMGGEAADEDPRPVIRISTEMTAVVDAMQQAILKTPASPMLFQRARRLCHMTRGLRPPDWLERALDAPVITPAAPAYLRELASQTAQWQKLDKRAKRWEPALPPPWTVETLQARASWPFQPLTGIVHAPTLRPDGSLLTTPGYDTATGLYLDTEGMDYPKIRTNPTLDDARSAIGHLQEAFRDFPWAHQQHDFSATLAALLSLVARYAMQGNVPLFAVRSTVRGSGKGLLIDTISTIATGRHAPRWAQTLDEEEEHKRLVTVGLAGDLTVHIDNVVHPLGSGPLDLALTAETISGRILGTQKEIEVPMHVVFFASGNNMVFRGDMARRVVPIDLDPRMERPEERDNFTHPLLLSWVRERRPLLLVAALTILRAYVNDGRPAQGVKPLGSFEPWSMLVRQALIWAGEADPCAGRQNIEAESDENFEKFAALLETWYACYQTTPQTLARVIDDASSKAVEVGPRTEWNDLRDALGAFDAKYDGKRPLGKPVSYALRAWKGRVIAGKRLVSAGKEHHAAQWQIELL